MEKLNLTAVGAVILAAGKGTRLNHETGPKVMVEIGGRPIVSYIVATLSEIGFTPEQICLVVGWQANRVRDYFGSRVTYAIQAELLGTAHATYAGIKVLPTEITDVIVLGGDDSAFYRPDTVRSLLLSHQRSQSVFTLLTAVVNDPAALGRVVRHADGRVEIIEKEYLTADQQKIKEISTGTFVFKRAWFEGIFPTMPKLRKLGEYGLPTALAMARDQRQPYATVRIEDSREWFGVNTPEQLAEADRRKRILSGF